MAGAISSLCGCMAINKATECFSIVTWPSKYSIRSSLVIYSSPNTGVSETRFARIRCTRWLCDSIDTLSKKKLLKWLNIMNLSVRRSCYAAESSWVIKWEEKPVIPGMCLADRCSQCEVVSRKPANCVGHCLVNGLLPKHTTS